MLHIPGKIAQRHEMCSKNTWPPVQRCRLVVAFPKRPEDRRDDFFEFSAVVSSLGQEQASKSEGSSGRFVGLPVILFVVVLLVVLFFKSTMKGF